MKDELISYETAKLAKEKGFDEECKYYYDTEKELDDFSYYAGNGTGFDQNSTCKENDYYNHKIDFVVPTQSLLQRWLREKHKLHLSVSYSVDHNKYSVNGYDEYHWNELKKRNPRSEGRFPYPYRSNFIENKWIYNTYEEALEVGLQEGLKLITI
jgi:hypothetical protein